MPPDTQSEREQSGERSKEKKHPHGNKGRVGNYVLGEEIGSGSFATVYKGHRSKSKVPIAIKTVLRQKLTSKLLENLESEINILKVIHNRNIVGLEDCFKNDTHIYLVMEYCSGNDLSVYLRNRGRLPTLDFVPTPSMGLVPGPDSVDGKVFWPHPPTGGLDQRVVRCFLGQLAAALRCLRSHDLIHRDIKPQNLLLHPASSMDYADGHPYGIPLLKVADFGFARILPAAAMAETLCGSPLYMAPEILRYEKYDAKADLWSVGAVLYEMLVGRPHFRASNHVELLRRIEKNDDRIKFPDESSRASDAEDPPTPVPPDLKALIRGLLKKRPTQRMSFDEFFASSHVWEVSMSDSTSTEEDGTLSLEVSTDADMDSLKGSGRIRDMIESVERSKDRILPTRAPQPLSTDPALNPQPAPRPQAKTIAPPAPLQQITRPIRRSEPKYYVSDDYDPPEAEPASSPNTTTTGRAHPRPINYTVQRQLSRDKEPASVEDPQPITPSFPVQPRQGRMSEGSPLAATPPITMSQEPETTGKDESALDGSDSVVGREYVVVEKRTVEINALADELDQASKKPAAVARRPSSRTSVVSRPVSAFKPGSSAPPATSQVVPPRSYSPPFTLSGTPPFAAPPGRRTSLTPLVRPPSLPKAMNVATFPPVSLPYADPSRFSTSPTALQTGALARALTNTAMRLIGTSADKAVTAFSRAAYPNRRRPSLLRTSSTDADPAEEELLRSVEDMARKAFVLFELADLRLATWQALAQASPAFLGSLRRKSSSSSNNSELVAFRKQELAAGEACMLYCRALGYIVQGTSKIQRFWEISGGRETSSELNDMVQWLRARFNECYEKAEWAKERCAEQLPFVERLVYEAAREGSKQAANAELHGDLKSAEAGYETALWQVQALVDDSWDLKEEDRASFEKFIPPIRARLDAARKKIAESTGTPTSARS
ncbi:hypothetical protein BCR39DRAFT_116114 [Naematelia encephala]|uniref:non-specific serine/threonine protein kinase n=1 Tax=Naematelia encephala TaxID=71784 RepID=A0A1Y2BJ19_9TREE|nr:hypothetical protein BCR39DRAFT_116114 [Naematelia encephala]